MEYLLVRLHRTVLALAPERVRAVVPLCQLMPAPETSRPILGVFNWQGRLVPLYDLPLRLGLGPSELRENQLMLIVDKAGKALALLVDEVPGVEDLPPDGQPIPYPQSPDALIEEALGDSPRPPLRLDLDRLLEEGWPEQPAPPPAAGSDLLAFRAVELAALPEQAQERDLVVVVTMGGEHYALSPATVREFCPFDRLVMVPGGPRTLSGLMNLRGQIVAVHDLRSAMGLPDLSRPLRYVAVIEADGELLGLGLEDLLGVVPFAEVFEGRSLLRVKVEELFDQHAERARHGQD